MLRLILSLATAAVFIACSNAQMNSEAPDTSLFLPVVNVGSNVSYALKSFGVSAVSHTATAC